ncbi:uncharacterized protein LOC135466628 [Liolophura sinensis]|uniref:uncharacterized protein LOC135466628 n=1 Tax=Liolophura sinensis TaxID=3198878 RepID=UPI0031581522
MNISVLQGRMGRGFTSHGISFTYFLSKWILFTILLILYAGIETASGITCYGAAQLSCYSNFTQLVILIQRRDEKLDQEMDTCGAFYAVQDCFIPHLANCDRVEQEMFIKDIVQNMAQPPYQCKNQSIDVLERAAAAARNGIDSSHPGLQILYTCALLGLIHTVINLVMTKEKR